MGMNTQTAIVSLSLLCCLSTGLAAQDLGLKTAANPISVIAGVDGAAKGSAVILVLGLKESPTKLPDGQLLGITPDLLAGFAIADGVNPTTMQMRLPFVPEGLTFYAQAVSIDLTRAPEDQKFGLSQVDTVVVRKS